MDFGLGANPEFLTEGTAVEDFLLPDRIVVGGRPAHGGGAARAVRRVRRACRSCETNAATAEMIKYASNAMLATAISFSNEIANLGSAIGGIDVVEVMRGVHLSRYLTTRLERRDLGHRAAQLVLRGGLRLRRELPAEGRCSAGGEGTGGRFADCRCWKRWREPTTASLPGWSTCCAGSSASCGARRITVLGLAFKPDTDDVRSSPALPVVRLLREAGAEVSVHDPVVGPQALDGLGDVTFVEDLADAVKQAEAVVIVTRWDDYGRLPELVGELDPPPLVVDGRRMIDRSSVPSYTGIGV